MFVWCLFTTAIDIFFLQHAQKICLHVLLILGCFFDSLLYQRAPVYMYPVTHGPSINSILCLRASFFFVFMSAMKNEVSRIRRTSSTFVFLFNILNLSPNVVSMRSLSSRIHSTQVSEHCVSMCNTSSFPSLHSWHIDSSSDSSRIVFLPGKKYVPVSMRTFVIPFLTSYVQASIDSHTILGVWLRFSYPLYCSILV